MSVPDGITGDAGTRNADKIKALEKELKGLKKILKYGVCLKGCYPHTQKIVWHSNGPTCSACGEELDDWLTSYHLDYLKGKHERRRQT